MANMETVSGAELRNGDAIEKWFNPKIDRIVALVPYTGPLAHLFSEGASIATFACGGGMTIDHAADFKRVAA